MSEFEKSKYINAEAIRQAQEQIAGLRHALKEATLDVEKFERAAQEHERLAVEQAQVGLGALVVASRELLEQCYRSDALEGLPVNIDGKLMDRVRDALLGVSTEALDAYEKHCRAVEKASNEAYTRGKCDMLYAVRVERKVRALSPDPNFLEREKLKAQLETAKEFIVHCCPVEAYGNISWDDKYRACLERQLSELDKPQSKEK